MKKVLLVITVTLLSIVLTAQNSNTDTCSVENKGAEKVIVSKNNSKIVAQYDLSGSLTKKILHQWDSRSRSWAPVKMYEYAYDLVNNQLILTYTQWNKQTDEWDKNPQVFTYNIETDGILSLH